MEHVVGAGPALPGLENLGHAGHMCPATFKFWQPHLAGPKAHPANMVTSWLAGPKAHPAIWQPIW